MMVRLIRNFVFLYFMSESLYLKQIQLQHLFIANVTPVKYKYLQWCNKEIKWQKKS